MLYLTCTMISSVDLAHYGVSHAKDWVSVDFVVQVHVVPYVRNKVDIVPLVCGDEAHWASIKTIICTERNTSV